MRIVIDIDEDVWLNAWLEWEETLYPQRRTLAAHRKVVQKRLVAGLGMAHERIRFLEDPDQYDEDDEMPDDEEAGE